MNKINNQVLITLDKNTLDEYNKYYFAKYPRRKVAPIKKPIPPSLNEYISMIRMAQNTLKGKYNNIKEGV